MKNKTLSVVCALLLNTLFLVAQTDKKVENADRNSILNTSFPKVDAKTLLNNVVQFPTITKGKIAIICIGFNDVGRPKTNTWVKEIPSKYADTSVVFYEMPMIKNAPKILRGVIEKGMRKGTDVALHDHVANYYGDMKTYQKQLLMPDENSCYTFVLDKNGVIQYSVEGAASAEVMEKIEKIVNQLKQNKT